MAGTLSLNALFFARTARLRRRLHTWSGSVVGHDGQAGAVSAKFSTVTPNKVVNGWFPADRRPDRRRRGADHPAVRCADLGQGDRRTRADRHHRPAHRGRLGVAARRGGRCAAHWRSRSTSHRAPRFTSAPRSTELPSGDNNYGADDLTPDFDIGRRQVVRPPPDRIAYRSSPTRGSSWTSPCSYGQADQPCNVTRSGIHVVTEKHSDYMSNPAAGYDRVHERWAVRISQRRVHPRQPGQLRRTGQHQRHQRLHQPSPTAMRSSTSTRRSTATRWR